MYGLMQIGNRVRHKKKDWIGIVLDKMKRSPGVLVNLSDEKGVLVRWIHRDNLEVIAKEKECLGQKKKDK